MVYVFARKFSGFYAGDEIFSVFLWNMNSFDCEIHEECGVFGIYGVEDAANLVYYGLHALTHNIVFPVIIAIVIAVVVYAVSLLLLKGLTESEIKRFPKGTSLVKLFRKLHLLK